MQREVAIVLLLGLAALPSATVAHEPVPQIRFKPGEPAADSGLVESLDGERALAALEENLKALLAYPQFQIRVRGFADSEECSGEGCEELSRRRARDTFNWLIARGVARERLIYEFYGASRPLIMGGNPINRRVEITPVVERPAAGR